MAWLARTLDARAGAPAGILPNRERAQAALLRMLSRARRRQSALMLVRMAPLPPPAAGGSRAGGDDRWLEGLGCDLRINDLAWREPGGVVLIMLEDASDSAALVERLRRRALAQGVGAPECRSARFPQQGLTLQSLLEEVACAI